MAPAAAPALVAGLEWRTWLTRSLMSASSRKRSAPGGGSRMVVRGLEGAAEEAARRRSRTVMRSTGDGVEGVVIEAGTGCPLRAVGEPVARSDVARSDNARS